MYAEQLAEMEAEIMRLGALRNNQVSDGDQWWTYQNRVTTITTRMLALEQAIPELEQLDAEIDDTTARMHRAQRGADHYMDLMWRVVKFTGIPGLLGVALSAAWTPTAWLPVVSGALVVTAVLTIAHAIRVRQDRYAPVDQAQVELNHLHALRNAILQRVHHGEQAPRSHSAAGGGWTAVLTTDDNAA